MTWGVAIGDMKVAKSPIFTSQQPGDGVDKGNEVCMFLRARVQRELTMCANRVLVFLCLAGQLHTFRKRISFAPAHLNGPQVSPGIGARLCSRLGRLHMSRPRMRSVGRRLFAITQKDAEI